MQTDHIIGALVNTQKQVDGLSRAGLHACGGTFAHSVAQAVVTTGTILEFDTEIRNSGLTKDVTNKLFTVNTPGMFIININWGFSAAATHTLYLRVNGITTNQFTSYGSTVPNYHTGMTMKYLQKGHDISFFMSVGVNVNVNSTPEDSTLESPILQICQVSPKFTDS
jgi:hypothetical protein